MKRPYTILKIAPTPFFSDYGCHVRILEEYWSLQNLGHRVNICTYPTGKDLADVECVRTSNFPFFSEVRIGSSKRKLLYDTLLAGVALHQTWKRRPDIIHGHLHEGALLGYLPSRLYNIPLVFDFQGSLTGEMLDHHFITRESLFYKPLRIIERVINNLADAIITSSHNAAEMLRTTFNAPEEKIFTISDSVNTEFFRPALAADEGDIHALKESLGIPPDRQVVVYLGLLADYQGIDYLLEAAQLLLQRGEKVHFLIMGYPGEQRYKLLATQLGLHPYTTFTGRLAYQDAPRYLRLGNVAVSPKLSETEGNGKLLNYMATGLPIVTFRMPVSQEILGDLGVYATTRNSASLADHISSLLAAPEASRLLGYHLRQRAQREFSTVDAALQMQQIYDSLIEKKSQREALSRQPVLLPTQAETPLLEDPSPLAPPVISTPAARLVGKLRRRE